MQQDSPGDYVIGTGKDYSVRQFTVAAFKRKGICILWKGEGKDEVGYDVSTKKVVVRVDPRFYVF